MSTVTAMMPAILAARAEAVRLGIPVLDDRILLAYQRAAEPILREQIAQAIEAKKVDIDWTRFTDAAVVLEQCVQQAILSCAMTARGSDTGQPDTREEKGNT